MLISTDCNLVSGRSRRALREHLFHDAEASGRDAGRLRRAHAPSLVEEGLVSANAIQPLRLVQWTQEGLGRVLQPSGANLSVAHMCRFIQDRASRILLKILAARPDKSAPVAVPSANGAG